MREKILELANEEYLAPIVIFGIFCMLIGAILVLVLFGGGFVGVKGALLTIFISGLPLLYAYTIAFAAAVFTYYG